MLGHMRFRVGFRRRRDACNKDLKEELTLSSIAGVGMITGAASGIGRALALRLAEEGMAVGVVDNRRDGAEATVEAVRQRGSKAAPNQSP